LITASIIPLAMLISFINMRFFGFSANLMSLGAIDFGMIVDGAVVMMENSIHRLEERREGESGLAAVRAAAHDVARPMTFRRHRGLSPHLLPTKAGRTHVPADGLYRLLRSPWQAVSSCSALRFLSHLPPCRILSMPIKSYYPLGSGSTIGRGKRLMFPRHTTL
jgi:AcrB/AcrD/AcrF family